MNRLKKATTAAVLATSLIVGQKFLRAQNGTQSQPSAGYHIVNQLNTETEVGTDSSSNFVSQYIFYDRNVEGRRLGISALCRYANVVKSVHHGEFAVGPNFHMKKVQLDTYIGGTTDGSLMFDAVGVVSLPRGFSAVAVSDLKPPLISYQNGIKQTTTWYRKEWIGRGHFWFRFEDFNVRGVGEAFAHVGGEVRVHPANKVELFCNPFFDYKDRKFGLASGVRLNIR